jgi:hypothetical protein
VSANQSEKDSPGSSLPPPEIPTLARPTASDQPAPKPQLGAIGLPPAEIKPLAAPAPVAPAKPSRSGCTAVLFVLVVLVVVAAFLIWWFYLRGAG